jgi:hypothetical protein
VLKPLMMLLALLLPVCSTVSRAQEGGDELKPILVVCISSYQSLLGDLQYIGRELKDDLYIERLNKVADRILQASGVKIDKIEGLDTGKPLGITIVTDGVEIIPMTILPASGDVETLLTSVKPLIGEAKKQDDTDLYAFGQGMASGYIKVANGWAYFAQLPEQLRNLPDPNTLFGDLAGKYDLGMEIHVQNLPEVFRSLAVDQLRISLESVIQKKSDETEAVFAFRREMGKLQSQLIERGLGEAEHVILGMTIDSEAGQGATELLLKPLTGSQTAAHLDQLHDLKTRYGKLAEGGIGPDLSLAMNMTGPLDETLLDEYASVVNAYRDYTLELIDNSSEVRSDEERQILKELASGIADVLRTTIEAGQLDLAARMVEKPKRGLVVAVHVKDGAELSKLVNRISELAQGDPVFTSVKLSAEEHAGTPIHRFTLKPNPDSREGKLARFFGGALQLNVAIQEDNLFLALGDQGAELIKQGLESGESLVPPMQAHVRLNPLLRLMAQLANQDALNTFVSLMSLQLGGDDMADVAVQVTSDGQLRVETKAQKGSIKLMGFMAGQAATILDLLQNPQLLGGASSSRRNQ